MSRRKRRFLWVLAGLGAILVAGLAIPERLEIPVQGASAADWNQDTFWYEPWGNSGVHKGIDIFADTGRSVLSASHGIVVYRGHGPMGGNYVVVLGPKWRLHYYAHLDCADIGPGRLVRPGTFIGSVGTTGNAAGKPPHLHYTILALLPHPWLFHSGTQGWKRMFFLDPGRKLVP